MHRRRSRNGYVTGKTLILINVNKISQKITILQKSLKRRAISYSPDPVPSEYVTLILSTTHWASSAANLQP